MNKKHKILSVTILSVITVLFLTTMVFAVVRLSINKQKVKTLHATFTYQDVIAAPQVNNDPSTRLLKITNIPADTEILSSYIKINTGFTHAQPYTTIMGALSIYSGDDAVAELLVGDVRGGGIISGTSLISGNSVIFDVPRELKMLIWTGGEDLVGLTGGAMQVFVNYLEHGN